MINHELNLQVEEAFGNLHRPRCVLVAAIDARGFILLGDKEGFYPPGICRLLGGGVKLDEQFEEAAKREVKEELKGVTPGKMSPLLHIVTRATDARGSTFCNETMVFQTDIGKQTYKPSDDISGVIKMPVDGLLDLGERYKRLSATLWHKDERGAFSWHDYGKMYGPIHTMAGQVLHGVIKTPGSPQSTWTNTGTMMQ